MRTCLRTLAILGILGSTLIRVAPAAACTGITIKPQDGSVIFARTLEFAVDLKSSIGVIPRGLDFTGATAGGEPGLAWTSRYGAVGMNMYGKPLLVDGLNEKGLQVGAFYFPGFAKFQEVSEDDRARSLAPHQLPTFLLGTAASVDEALNAVRQIKVGEVVFSDFGFVPPAHLILTDASGKAAVIEYVKGELHIHDNPLGVMSNSPTFDWHMINLGNYVNLSANNISETDIGGVEVKGLGQGTGMLGLPGDFTPPSRFLRAVVFSKSALPVATAQQGVLQAFHLLNQFDIPKGAARGLEHGHVAADYTLWTSAADLQNLRYYFRTFENSRIRMVDLTALDLGAPEVKQISTAGEEQIEDLSGQAR